MNKELIKQVREKVIEELRWDQRVWFHNPKLLDKELIHHTMSELAECGTGGCVAGWACMLAPELKDRKRQSIAVFSKATELLGITVHVADYLFDSDRTKTDVLSVLDWLITYEGETMDKDFDSWLYHTHIPSKL